MKENNRRGRPGGRPLRGIGIREGGGEYGLEAIGLPGVPAGNGGG